LSTKVPSTSSFVADELLGDDRRKPFAQEGPGGFWALHQRSEEMIVLARREIHESPSAKHPTARV
jgi:hypothetical protein